MAYRLYKDDQTLTYDANVKRLRTEGTIILNDVLNEAIHEMTEEFKTALNQGKILKLTSGPEDLKRLMRRAAEKELAPVTGGQRALPGKK